MQRVVPKGSLEGPFWLFGSLFILQGPYFQRFWVTALPADDIKHILFVQVVQKLERVSSTNENGLRMPSIRSGVLSPTKSPGPRWQQDTGSQPCGSRRKWIPKPQKLSWQSPHTHPASSKHMEQKAPVGDMTFHWCIILQLTKIFSSKSGHPGPIKCFCASQHQIWAKSAP